MIEGNEIISVIKYNQLKVFNPNNSWNWLMEVVEKIESIADYIVVDICGHVCKIGGLTDQFIIGTGDSKMEAVYNCCVSFVKWYNLNKK